MASKYPLTKDEDVSDLFSNLPVELKMRILHYIDGQTIRQSVVLVNKDFNNLAKDSSLYRRYETPDFDVPGYKTLQELNNYLYKAHLKVLTTNNYCLEKLDLTQHTSLEKVIVEGDVYSFSFYKRRLPENIKSIEVHNELTPEELPDETVGIKVDVLLINQEEELRDMLNTSADRYLIHTGIVSSAENLHRVLAGDLHYLLEMENVSFHCSSKWSDLVNLLGHFPEKLTEICMELLSSDDVNRQTILRVCEECTSLEYFKLIFHSPHQFPIIEKVASERLQTLILQKSCRAQEGDVLRRCELLIRATRREITISGLKEIPEEVLSYLNPSLPSLTLVGCDWSSDRDNVDERILLRKLTLDNTPAVPILLRIGPGLRELILDYVVIEKFGENLATVDSLSSLEVFSTHDDTFSVLYVLEALSASKHSLRVFKYLFRGRGPGIDERQMLQLLRGFHQLQYFEIRSKGRFPIEEVKKFYPTSIIKAHSKFGIPSTTVFL